MTEKDLFPFFIRPGVKRDGTVFSGDAYVDALWTRWQKGKPRKMLGYRQMQDQFSGIQRGCNGYSKNGLYYVHGGGSDTLEQAQFDSAGYGAGIVDRTPVGFSTDDNNVWTMGTMYDGGGASTIIIAHAAPNLEQIDSSTAASVYYGDVTDTAALSAIASSSVSGGICIAEPYLFVYGSDGYIGWSVPNDPTDLTNAGSGNARVTGGKVLAGLPMRAGTGVAPAALFWAQDALVRSTFAGGSAVFNFDRITSGYSILSSRGMIEMDGIFYWAGLDRFLQYNGVIKELQNPYSIDFFYDNLNLAQRQKVFTFKNPRFGEIGWAFPYGSSTEANWAVIYNVRENTWYDTPLPEDGRSAFYYDGIFPKPIMFGVELSDTDKTQLWMHETGYDKVVGSSSTAIRSYYKTSDLSLPAFGYTQGELTGVDANTYFLRFEPDFILSGNLKLTVSGKTYAQADEQISTREYAFSGTTKKLDIREQYREMYMLFESNEAGGYFEEGQSLMKLKAGDTRPA